MFSNRVRRTIALVATFAVLTTGLVVVDLTDPIPATAADDGSLDLAFSGPDEILLGETATYTLAATNNGSGSDLYNLSWRLTLPAGATITDSTLGAPDIKIGDSTYVWINVEDLQTGVTKSHTVDVDYAHPTWDVNQIPGITANAYASGDARLIPDFDTVTGLHVDNDDTTAFDTRVDQTQITAVRITKDEPNAESELLRGVHDEWTTYTLTIQNNFENPTDTIVVDDWLPAGVEFLGCGGVDNTTASPVTNDAGVTLEEYPGSGALGVGVAPSNPGQCIAPDLVETVSLAADTIAPGQLAGVYTHVQWVIDAGSGVEPNDDGSLLAGETFDLTYAAGIPLRENELFGGGFTPDTTGEQIANLDNNTGALTSDEQQWINWSQVSGTYRGPSDLPAIDVDSEVVIAEDLSIHKTVSTDTFEQGTVSRWTLLIETGEYRDASSLVVTDTLPDGLCPLPISGTAETSGTPTTECNAIGGQQPTVEGVDTDPNTIVENSDGTWTLTWNTLRAMDESDDVTIEFSTVARGFYQEGFADDVPVVGGDSWNNTVSIIGTTDPLNDTDGAEPDRVLEVDTVDASAAGQSAETLVITKLISPAAPAGDPLDCDTTGYIASTSNESDLIP